MVMNGRESTKNPYSTAKIVKRPSASSPSEEVKSLLPKLRPFQKEAYLFATQGKVSERLQQPSTSSSKNDDCSFEYDPSLIGKGRLLLADEMGLGVSTNSIINFASQGEYYQ